MRALTNQQVGWLRYWALPAELRHSDAGGQLSGRNVSQVTESLKRRGLLTSDTDRKEDPVQLTQDGWRELRRIEVLEGR